MLAGARDAAARDRAAADASAASAASARAAADTARAARDHARARVERALEEARAAAREAEELAQTGLTRTGLLPTTGVQDAWRPVPRAAGQRSFASVDLRVFDAFTEADLADEDAVLDAPVRRGRHVAAPDPVLPAARPADEQPTAPVVRPVAGAGGPAVREVA